MKPIVGTKEELQARLEQLENAIFFLNMKDRWDSRDYRDSDLMFAEKMALIKAIKEKE